ncbi:hypothetical protein EJ357_16155 [Streptomyces cyaneochromogenes]|uniref:Uncharacterized protein n=1 Tax=Streptomyces cyaneochromogenes TaxID=2496836 RepID=A0A3Q9EMQ0_9ACTN|nr:hypothetical protein [Streptomyces cyaneochromogenes]AZQ34830.1 hypothetical protein EJ357_16155 [Streptomyces cyaneochromogenes]
MARISKAVLAKYGPSKAGLLDYLILRNDWKASSAFRRIMSMPEVASAFLRDFRLEGSDLDLTVSLEPIKIGHEGTPGYLFDSAIYANRLYQATSEGLFESRFNPDREIDEMPLVQFLEHETRCVSAQYMAVNASAEERGLWFAPIRLFDIDGDDYEYGEGELWDPFGENEEGYPATVIRRSGNRMEQVADYSASCSSAARHLLNYTDAPMPGFLRAHDVRGRSHERAQFDEWMVTGYEQERSIEELTQKALSFKASRGEGDEGTPAWGEGVEVLGNSSYRLLVKRNDVLEVVNVSAFENRDVAVKKNAEFRKMNLRDVGGSEILSTRDLASGFAIELFDSISVVTASSVFSVYREPAARIRTFRASRRYKDVLAIAGEKDLALVGFVEFDDDEAEF